MALTAAEVHRKKAEITGPGGVFELEDIQLDGRGYKAYKHAPRTLTDVLQSGRAHGDIEFLVYEGQRFTYTRFYEQVDALAAALQKSYGIHRGDRVAIAMRNNPQWAIAYVAATLVGAVVVPINSWGKAGELLYALNDSGSKMLVCDEARYRLVESELPALDLDVLVAGELRASADAPRVAVFDTAMAQGEGVDYAVLEATPEDYCLILYTSGSTGFPKGVLHRHIAVTQSLMNMFFLGYLVMELEGPREFRGGAERETPMLTVPLFHATGLLGGLLLPLQTGQKVVVMYKWDASKALQLIQQEKVTGLASVPAVIQDLMNTPDFDKYDTSSLMRVSAAGAATPAGLPELIEAKVGSPSRSAGYGMTETMAVAATMSGAVFDLSPDSAGVVSPIMELRFVDAQGNEVASGQPGEIEMYSVCTTPGYWDKPEANAATFDEDGWMKTGDVGLVDEDGFLHITGRIKEIVIRGGENIFPGEIEQAAYTLEDIQENVVFGVPDAAMGEELAMVYYCRPGSEVDEQQLRDYLNQHLARYKVPRYIQVSDTPLPQNASGKLHKLRVKEHFVEALPA